MATDQSEDRAGLAWAFPIGPGWDHVVQLHRWLDTLKGGRAIGNWYDGGTITDYRGARALVEFEDPADGELALSEWYRRGSLTTASRQL
ncbi:hypothetical protein JNW90_23660 [Micromonospora sp. STR1s_5]|nr:hypothetical protein [Micromonospora sp. STR1s_5]